MRSTTPPQELRRLCRPVTCPFSGLWRLRGARSAESTGDFAPTYPFDQCGLIFKAPVVDFLWIANVEEQTMHF